MGCYLTNCTHIVITLVLWSHFGAQNVKSLILPSPISRNISIKLNQEINITCVGNTNLQRCNFLSPTNTIYILHRNEAKKCYESERICLFIKLPNQYIIRFKRITIADSGTWECRYSNTFNESISKNHDAIVVRKQPISILLDSFAIIIDETIKSNQSITPYLYGLLSIIVGLVFCVILSYAYQALIIIT